MQKISFIIRFYNEAKYIGECLNAIAHQKGNYQIQIVLVNSNSTDNSLNIVNSFKDANPQIEIIIINNTEKFTFSSAINKALNDVNGEYSVILSAHATLATDEWLNKILNNFNDPKVAISYGRLLMRRDANTQSLMTSLNVSMPYKIIKSKDYFTRNGDEKNAFAYLNLNTCNVIRTDLLKKYKFKELPSVEDMELGKRLLDDGYKIVYEPEATIWHSHNDSTEKMVIRWINAAVGIKLIFSNKVPGQFALIKSTIPSFILFMFKVSFKEKHLLKKLFYLFRGVFGSVKIIYKVLFEYADIKKWEVMYANN